MSYHTSGGGRLGPQRPSFPAIEDTAAGDALQPECATPDNSRHARGQRPRSPWLATIGAQRIAATMRLATTHAGRRERPCDMRRTRRTKAAGAAAAACAVTPLADGAARDWCEPALLPAPPQASATTPRPPPPDGAPVGTIATGTREMQRPQAFARPLVRKESATRFVSGRAKLPRRPQQRGAGALGQGSLAHRQLVQVPCSLVVGLDLAAHPSLPVRGCAADASRGLLPSGGEPVGRSARGLCGRRVLRRRTAERGCPDCCNGAPPMT